jgi:hypothetical protein
VLFTVALASVLCPICTVFRSGYFIMNFRYVVETLPANVHSALERNKLVSADPPSRNQYRMPCADKISRARAYGM